MNEKISIIVPVYKTEKWLDKCVNSVVNQTYSNLEIILVDDGSPDNCPEICDEWAKKDNRIVVIHKENGGVADARNIGMVNASGEYLAFVDSDDYVEEDFVEKLYFAMKDNNADLAVCSTVDGFEDDEIEFFNREKTVISCFELRGYNGFVCNKLYKTDIIKGNSLSFSDIMCEDMLFNFYYCINSNGSVFIKKKLYNYVNHSGSLSSSNNYNERNGKAVYTFYDTYKSVVNNGVSNQILKVLNAFCAHLVSWMTYSQFSSRVKISNFPLKISALSAYLKSKSYPSKNKLWLLFIIFARPFVNLFIRKTK